MVILCTLRKWLLILYCTLGFMGVRYACAQNITLEISEAPITQIFSTINTQYGFHFVYVSDALDGLPPVSIRVQDVGIQTVMEQLVQDIPLSYAIRNKTIAITRKEQEEGAPAVAVRIAGYVVDTETQQPIPNVNGQFVGTNEVFSTTADGEFNLSMPASADSIRWSAVGYYTYTEAIPGDGPHTVQLQPMTVDIDEVVVTGIVERERSHYTSATTTLTGAELRQRGNGNVLNSIATLDPSFIIVPNNLQGSNPNAFAQIELRGKTSISGDLLKDQFATDPNLPLFILDGFESTLQQIADLDINRIESVTLLKDAASSALYGARSANGVVVVETVKPTPGKLGVFFRSDLGAELADLSDYNVMNAAEKLEFERLAGRYSADESPYADGITISRVYNERLRKVLQGVDTYWLDKPIRTGIMHNQSLYVQGGDEKWRYGVGGNYRQRQGVIKGSGRNSWSAYADVVFHTPRLDILSKSSYFGGRAFDSPGVHFADYTRQNPLYTVADTATYLATIPHPNGYSTFQEPNYLYNARLNSREKALTHAFTQQLSASWRLSQEWELVGRVQLAYDLMKADTFWSPKDTRYNMLNPLEKGEYIYHKQNKWNYQGNLMGIWNHTLAPDHYLTLNLRTEIMEIDANNLGYRLQGFPEQASGKPREAYNFTGQLLEPMPSPPKIRRVNGLVSANYNFSDLYFADATLRVDGSTQFGSANRYAWFWSAGLGWNLHHAAFAERWSGWLTLLRLRVNTGLTGNQGFGSFASTVSYHSISGIDDGGLVHESLGNPLLEWQGTRQTNIGLDVELWDGRFSFTANLFEKLTSPLIATLDLPLSTGVSDYSLNVGDLRLRGYEGVVRFSPVYQPSAGWIWTIGATALGYRSHYEHLSPVLTGTNEQRIDALTRFQSGYSPDDLWAVRSWGIDPTTGREVFLTTNGQPTYTYSRDDIVKVGNQRPWVEGVLSSYMTIKGFQVGAYFRYSIGGSRFNQALYEKVENINFDDLGSNQDRRALYDRWQQPGDQARFRGISLMEDTPMSSRFIQKENVLSGESLSVGYVWDTTKTYWLRQTGVEQLRITGYANNFLRWSNILAERGTDYPFSRTFSLSVGLVL